MGRYSPNPSYAHKIHRLGPQDYRLTWVCDRYYRGSRLRHPTANRRDTDKAGARRFAKRWGISMPS